MKLICYSFSEKTRRIRANDHHINAMEGFARRHRSDNQINNRETKTVVEHELVTRKWKDIKVGDMVRLENNEFITADIVLISTSEHNGLCYIETAELDGETNLKKRVTLEETCLEIQCETPNNNLGRFAGNLTWKGKTLP
ncbi:unnamed protein product [Rotaria sp. Silwood2]|nr:unnamed protein product [Rotaria sp. Silwood2]